MDIKAEQHIYQQIQMDSFTEDYKLLKAGKPIPSSKRFSCLALQYDMESNLIRVGGRLRWVERLDQAVIHPIVLDPSHPYTKLLIQDVDVHLCHPGAERVFAQLCHTVWIL
ncbi:hypothetical protein LDENG_00018270 [Lucifuga dentata]|nr:hypothetical protein LDENG_00018270 [Lucifuga dentata]